MQTVNYKQVGIIPPNILLKFTKITKSDSAQCMRSVNS